MSPTSPAAPFLVVKPVGPHAPHHVGPPPTLTVRERQVLGLVGQGQSNQEIAEMLFLSINSVKTYIRSTYRKIGVERRTQAVIWWYADPQGRSANGGTAGR